MPGPDWLPEEDAWFPLNPEGTYAEFTNEFGTERTYHGWRHRRKTLRDRITTREMATDQQAVVGTQTVRDPATDAQWDAYFSSLFDANEHDLSTMQQSTDWYAPDDGGPVGIVLTGDWHVGARGVLYRQLERDLDTLRDTPGLYGIHMGDAHEGVSIHSKAAPALYSGLFNSGDEQEQCVRMLMRRGGPKWLAWLAGNHDEWVYKHAGLSRIGTMAEALGIPHFGEGGGTVFAHVGHQRYAIGVRHNAPGNSRLNTTNSQRRLVDDWPEWETLHVAAVAHLHFNDCQIASRHGGRTVYLRSGTYKVHDGYAKAGGFTPEYGTPLLILLPDEERIIPFRGDDLEHGLAHLALLRARYAQRGTP